jgi:hypothetical protein
MLNLIIKHDNDAAVAQVRWCLDEGGLEVLAALKQTPYIMLHVRYEDKGSTKDSYQLFPVNQYQAYLPMRFAGKVRINAVIVTSSDNETQPILDAITHSGHRSGVIYKAFSTWTVENPRYTNRHPDRYPVYINVNTFEMSIDNYIEVSESGYGAELPAWLGFVVNRYWYDKKRPADQCAQRRRVLAAPITNVPLFLVEFVIRVVYNVVYVLIMTLLGMTSRAWSVILHPFDDSADPSIEWNHQHQYGLRKLERFTTKHGFNDCMGIGLIMLFLPVVVPGLGVLMGIIVAAVAHSHSMLFLHALMIVIGSYLSLLVAFGLGCVIYYGVSSVLYTMDIWHRMLIWFDAKFPIPVPDQYLTDERAKILLTCPTGDSNCLPELKTADKSWWLRFLELKYKVCKPLQG